MISRLAPLSPFFSNFTNIRRRMRGGFHRLPIEISELIFGFMDAETKINVTLAAYRFSDRDIEWLTHEEI